MNVPLPKRNPDGSYTTRDAGMAIDGDGGYRTYGPPGTQPLDYLANAGAPGNWWGIVTVNGVPHKQLHGDPYPGYYVSPTSYEHDGHLKTDPRRYVDSESVIYIVLPSHWRKEAKGVVLGCKAHVLDRRTGKTADAVVADFGPRAKLGEASIACAKYFGIPSSPKNGGTAEKRFIYTFFPGIAADGYELKPM